jgi:hypothetical protein
MTRSTVPLIVTIGVWAWGSATALLAVATFVFLIVASTYICPDGHFPPSAPTWIAAVYVVLKDHNQLVAAILAVSGLAWSYFFQWKK